MLARLCALLELLDRRVHTLLKRVNGLVRVMGTTSTSRSLMGNKNLRSVTVTTLFRLYT